MEKCKVVAKYLFTNRRIIGVIVGSLLTLAGYHDEGRFVQNLGEQ